MLAGGRSSRTGRDKATLEWGGATFLAHLVDVVGRGTGGEVVVVRAPGQELPAVDARVVEDAEEGRGPLMGIAAGLAAVEAEVVFVAAVDLPRLTPAVVAHIADALGHCDAAVPVTDRDHPLAAAYRRAPALEAAERLLAEGQGRAMALVGALRVRRVHDVDADALVNVNSPEDYGRARAGLKSVKSSVMTGPALDPRRDDEPDGVLDLRARRAAPRAGRRAADWPRARCAR